MMKTEGIFTALRSTLSGFSSQMKRLEVISENIANAERVPDKGGEVYRRKVVVETGNPDAARRGRARSSFREYLSLPLARTRSGHMGRTSERLSGGGTISEQGAGSAKYEVREVGNTRLVHDPSHPQADEKGYVKMPEVDVVGEMVDLISASRGYEANVTVMNAAKQMAKRALEI